jgi:hypothetical protein
MCPPVASDKSKIDKSAGRSRGQGYQFAKNLGYRVIYDAMVEIGGVSEFFLSQSQAMCPSFG